MQNNEIFHETTKFSWQNVKYFTKILCEKHK